MVETLPESIIWMEMSALIDFSRKLKVVIKPIVQNQ